ncbi:unnamed protein product, partial [Iphiclides podalirius]
MNATVPEPHERHATLDVYTAARVCSVNIIPSGKEQWKSRAIIEPRYRSHIIVDIAPPPPPPPFFPLRHFIDTAA